MNLQMKDYLYFEPILEQMSRIKKAGPTFTAKDGFGPARYYCNIQFKIDQIPFKRFK